MRKWIRWPSPAMVVAIAALFVALGSAAFGRGGDELRCLHCVDTRDLDTGAVKERAVATDAVTDAEIRSDSVSTEELDALPSAAVRRTGIQEIDGAAATPIQWQEEVWETGPTDVFSAALPRQLTAPEDGVYRFRAAIEWEAHADNGQRNLLLILNDGPVIEQVGLGGQATNNQPWVPRLSTVVSLEAGDFVELWVIQVQSNEVPGTPLDVLPPNDLFSPQLSIEYVSEP